MLPLNARSDEFTSLYYTALGTGVSVSIEQIRNKGTKTSAHLLLNMKFIVTVITYPPQPDSQQQNHSGRPTVCICFQKHS